MGIVSWILFGLVAGALAKFLLPGKDPSGCLVTVVLGIVGAAIGGWIATQLGFGSVDRFDFRSLFFAIIGAILVLLVLRVARRK